jgi:hypothetical protein
MPGRRRGQEFATSRLPIRESKFSLQPLDDRSENFTDHLLVSLPELPRISQFGSNRHFRFLVIDDHSDEIVASRRSFSDRFLNR